MAIQGFNYKEMVLGTGDTLAYGFDFKIYDPTHLNVIVQDSSGTVVREFRGDDATQVSSLVFDTDDGGGTLTLVSDLESNYVLTMFLAPDAPDQPTDFPYKTSFTLPVIAAALDYLGSMIQRVAFLAQRAIRIHDVDDVYGGGDVDAFDPRLPAGIRSNPGATVVINDTGDGFDYGATLGEIANAQTYANDAITAKNAAAASAVAAAASAAAAAASAAAASAGMTLYGTYAGPLNITAAGGITNNIPGEQGQFIHGSPGAVVISANPQIQAGTVIGQRITLIGVDDANTVKLTNGNGLRMNGDITLGDGDLIRFFYDGTSWQEEYRNAKT